MKNYFILLLSVVIIFLCSVIYKTNKSSFLEQFPIHNFHSEKSNPVIYLIFIFSMNNCDPCLDVIDVLNGLSEKFKVVGLIPEFELNSQDEVRKITGARFDLCSRRGYEKYMPNYSPTLFGVSKTGKILFILPGVPGEHIYLQQFLDSFLLRASSLLKTR